MKDFKEKVNKVVERKINELITDIQNMKEEFVEQFEQKEKEIEILKSVLTIEIDDLIDEVSEEYIKLLQIDGKGTKQEAIKKFKEALE